MMGLLHEAVDRATSLSGSANIAVIGGCQMFAVKMEEVGGFGFMPENTAEYVKATLPATYGIHGMGCCRLF